MKENKSIWLKPLICMYLVIMTITVSYFASNLWGRELWPNEKFTVVVISSLAFLILLLLLLIKIKNIMTVFVLYQGAVILSVIFMLISYEYRPVMAIFMLITLFAGLDTGMTSVLSISVAVSFLYGAEQEYMYGTVIIGAAACFVAHFAKDRLKFIISTVMFLSVSFFVNGIFQYYNTEKFDYSFAVLSLASVIISMIVFINVHMITGVRSVEQYIKEDSEIIQEMKGKSLTLYYHSMEVAELSLEGAKVTDCNIRLAYGGGILHDIGKVRNSEDYVKAGLAIANEYGMPREIKAIIVEHSAKYRIPVSKESAIVMLADSVISSVEYLKVSNKEVSEKKIIENVFQVRLNGGALEKSGLTLKEFSDIKTAFLHFYNV